MSGFYYKFDKEVFLCITCAGPGVGTENHAAIVGDSDDGRPHGVRRVDIHVEQRIHCRPAATRKGLRGRRGTTVQMGNTAYACTRRKVGTKDTNVFHSGTDPIKSELRDPHFHLSAGLGNMGLN